MTHLARSGFQFVTTAERDALPSPFQGQTVFNSDRNVNETFDGDVWLNRNLIRAVNQSGQTLLVGQPVVASSGSSESVTLSSVANETGILGVVVDGDLTNGAVSGDYPVWVNGTIGVGTSIIQSSTLGEATAVTSDLQGTFAVSRGSLPGPGPALVDATLQPTSRTTSTVAPASSLAPLITLTSSSGSAYIETTSTTYDVLAQAAWPGSDATDIPSVIYVAVELGGGTSMSVRILDATNAQVIAELTGITVGTFTVLSMGAPANVSATPAVWEVQALGAGGGRKARVASVAFVP
jgi:hypothetical protein